jgi:hypothetical protein
MYKKVPFYSKPSKNIHLVTESLSGYMYRENDWDPMAKLNADSKHGFLEITHLESTRLVFFTQ